MSRLTESQSQGAATASRIQRVVSPLGIEAWLIEEYAVPLIAMEFSFKGGSSDNGAGKAGLSHLLSGLFDEGAGPYNAVAFHELLDEYAIHLNLSSGRDDLSGSLKTLVRHSDKAFELLKTALNDAHFDAPSVERVKAQIQGSLRRSLNDPNSLSSKAWSAKAFAGHAYASPDQGTIEELATLTSDDIRAIAKRTLAREHLKIAVVGAISASTLAAELDRIFGALPAKSGIADVPAITPKGMGEIEIIDLDIPQSTIRFGMPGLLMKDPDFISASVMNHILGGGSFTSRIWQEVREKRGLAYSVSTGLYPYAKCGLFFGGTATKNDRAKEALDVIRDEIDKMASDGPTEEELDKAKRYLIGSYALRFDTSPKIAKQLLQLQVEDMGIDYPARRNDLFAAVSLEDTQRVAKRLLAKGEMLVTIAGRPLGF
ncbi:MAG: M16 family metallopeptidase [Beijerinckiaceae bacterium]